MTSVGTVLSYPIPAYSNLPIEAQFYQPSRFVISGITMGQTTTVTTSIDHNYVVSQQVKLLIPTGDGATKLNGAFGYVLSVPTTTSVEVSIDSVGVNTFVAANPTQDAQIIAIGDINSGPTNASGRSNTQTYIDGSFINISPQ